MPTDRASPWPVFAAVPSGQHPDAAGQLGGHDLDAATCQLGGQRSSQTGCALDRPGRMRPAAGEAAQLPVTVMAGLDADRGEGLQTLVDRNSSPGCFVRIDRDDDRGKGP